MVLPIPLLVVPCVAISATVYPDSLVTLGSWSTSPLWPDIDDLSDAEYISTPTTLSTTPVNYECEVGCANPPSAPGGSACQTLTFLARVRKVQAGTGFFDCRVQLIQGTSVIATVTSTGIGTSFVDVSKVLSISEYDSITNHNDLRLRIRATLSVSSGIFECSADCSQARIVYS